MKTKNYTGSLALTGFVVLLFAVLTQNVWAQTYMWATRTGSTSSDEGNALATDASGNVYVAGSFKGTVDFDPSAGTVNLTSAGDADIFVQKLNSSGNLVWAKKMGGIGNDGAYSIAVDASGNVFITGFFANQADFDPGAGFSTFTSYGSYDVFVEKLNASGDMVWVKRVGNTGHDVGRGIDIDASGNVYVTGNFSNTVDFDPGLGSYSKTSVGGYDIFVLKLNSLGSFEGVYTGGGTQNDAGQDIDIKGNYAYVTGYFKGAVDFDPNIDTPTYTSAGDNDIFMMRIETTGSMDFDYVRCMGGSGSDVGKAIAVDAVSNIYVAGYFSSTANFNPAGTNNLTSAGSTDAFVLKLGSTGNYAWAKKTGGPGADQVNDIAIDGSIFAAVAGNVYVTGEFSNTVDFNPGASTFNLVSAGSTDAYTQKLNADGSFAWAKVSGGSGLDGGNAICVNWSSNITHTIGNFSNTVDFNPNAGIANLYAAGYTDVFVQKLSAPATCTLSVSTGFIVNATCGSGGSATVIISGGASPYTTLWSNGSTNLTANNLTNGTYTVTVTDNNGCTQTASAYIGSVAPAVPSGITATSTNTLVTIQWATVANAATYGIRIRKQGAASWTYINLLAGSSATVTALMSCSTYEYGVKSNCSGGSPSSNYSATQFIQTTGCIMEGKTEITGTGTQNSMKLYPNPARQQVNLSYSSATNQTIEINIFDLNGRLMLQQNAQLYNGENNIIIPISALPKSYYVIETISTTERLTEKLLVVE